MEPDRSGLHKGKVIIIAKKGCTYHDTSDAPGSGPGSVY
jgi:hypothetical protein